MSHEWDKLRSHPKLNDYERGYLDGLEIYCWYKDGVRYVGTTGRTLNAAAMSFVEDRLGSEFVDRVLHDQDQ